MKYLYRCPESLMEKCSRKNFKPLGPYFGTIIMAAAVSLLLFTYFPILSSYLQPPIEIKNYTDNEYHLIIPKINAESIIRVDVDPWNQASYLPQLQKGVAHAKGTPLPGENGTSYIFTHLSDLPWRMTRYNTPFLRLGELSPGDLVYISKDNQTTEYKVTGSIEVAGNDIKYLKEAENSGLVNAQSNLILQTCSPPGMSLRRLLVFAVGRAPD